VKILIIRFSSIGDVILTSPVIRWLSEQTQAEIHFLTKPFFVPLVAHNPHVKKVYTLPPTLHTLIATLQEENYDFIVDLHKNLRSLRIRLQLKRPTLSFDKINIQKWLHVRFKWEILPSKHLVDRYLEGLASLDIEDDYKGLDLFIPDSEHIDVVSLFPQSECKLIIGLALGAGHFTKQIPLAKLQEIVSEITDPILLLGGPADQALGEALVPFAKGPIINTCGSYSLLQSASLVRQCTLLITPDTGLMHVAAAFQVPTLSFWGNTVPAFGFYPYYADPAPIHHIAEIQDLPCRPCSKIGHPSCPKGHFNCMMKQDMVQEVRNMLNRVQEKRKG